MTEEKTIHIPKLEVTITFSDKGGAAIDHPKVESEAEDAVYALILAHAAVGIDVESPQYLEGVESTLEVIFNLEGREEKEPEEKTYIVTKREVWHQMVEVKATSEEGAIEQVCKGCGDYLASNLEHSHDLSSDTWTVEEQ